MLEHSSSELLPWLFLANDNIVVNKDGSFMACLEIRGKRSDILSQEQKEILSLSYQKAIELFKNEPVSLWWTIHKREDTDYPTSFFSNHASQIIEKNRELFFLKNTHYRIYFICSLLFSPRIGINKFMQQFYFFHKKKNMSIHQSLFRSILFYFGENSIFPYIKQELVQEIEYFESLIEKFTATFSSSLKRLSDKDQSLGRFLYQSINPASTQKNISIGRKLIDSFITDNKIDVSENFLSFFQNSNRKIFCSAMTLKMASTVGGENETRTNSMIQNALKMPCEMSLSLCFRILSQQDTKNYITKMKRLYSYQMYSWKTYAASALFQSDITLKQSIPSRKDLFDQCDELLYEMDRTNLVMGKLNYTLLLYGSSSSDLEKKKKAMQRFLHARGVMAIEESDHLLSSWLITQPGMDKECCRWSILSSENVGDMLPHIPIHNKPKMHSSVQSSAEKEEKRTLSILSSHDQQKIFFNPFLNINGHCFIVGPTGSGKSTFANFHISQFQKYPNCSTFILDYDYSSKNAVIQHNGLYIDPVEETHHKMNPFSLLKNSASRIWLKEWILLLCDDQDKKIKNQYSHDIDLALESMSTLKPSHWNLNTFSLHMTSESIKNRLHHWIHHDFYKQWFSDEHDVFDHALCGHSLIGIEMKNLLDKNLMWSPLIHYIFYRIEQCIENKKSLSLAGPSLIYIAECWRFLSQNQLMTKINIWLKTMRKHGCSVWMDTQSIEDLYHSRLFPSIRDNIATRVFLANKHAVTHSIRDIYRFEFSLSDEQILYLSQSRPQRDFLILKEKEEYTGYLDLDQESLSILSSEAR